MPTVPRGFLDAMMASIRHAVLSGYLEYLGMPSRGTSVGGVTDQEAGMFGWRKRIGYIAPTVIEVVAYEFYRFAPDGIGLTGVTCSIDDWRPEEFEKALAQVAAAAA